MAVTFHNVSGLRHLVRSMWSIEGDSTEATLPGLVAPDGQVEFVFHIGAPWRMKSVAAVGWIEQSRAFVYAQRHGCLQFEEPKHASFVAFRVDPIVASAILRQPLRDLWDAMVPLEDLVGSEAHALADRFAACDRRQQCNVLESWILSRLSEWGTADQNLQDFHNTLFWCSPQGPLSSVVAALGPSMRSLRRWFAATAGMSPKEVQLAGRVLTACSMLREHPDLEVTRVAHGVGYYDHAAFTHAFVRRVGFTPSEFRKVPRVYYERTVSVDRAVAEAIRS